MSSGSSAWEGQLQSMILSEYASTEMSLHALYMHEVSSLKLGWPEGWQDQGVLPWGLE